MPPLGFATAATLYTNYENGLERVKRAEQLTAAAKALVADYNAGGELTAFTSF